MRRVLAVLALTSLAAPAAAQVPLHRADPAAAMRLQNELQFQETRQRALEARIGRLQTQQTIRRMERQRLPDATLQQRQSAQDTAESEAALRAQQAQSTARAARLRTGLAAFGYADTLPLVRPR